MVKVGTIEVRLGNTLLGSTVSYYDNSVKQIDLSSPCASLPNGCDSNMTMNLTFTGIKNPNFYVNITDTMTVISTTTEGWNIDKGISLPLYQMFNAL